MNKKKTIFSFLWCHIRPHKWYYLLMLQAPILNGFFPFFYNYGLKFFIEALSKKNISNTEIIFPIVIFLFSEFFLNVSWRLSNFAEWKAEPLVRRSILLETYNYVQYHSYTFFQNNLTGTINSKMKSILEGYDTFWAEVNHGLSARIMTAVISLGSLFYVNLNLALFTSFIFLLFLSFVFMLTKKMSKLAFDVEESEHNLFGEIGDKINNIITIFTFNRRKWEYIKLKKDIDSDYVPKQIKEYKFINITQIFGGIVYLLSLAFMLCYLVHLRKKGIVTISSIVFIMGIFLVIFENLWHFMLSFPDFIRKMSEFDSSLSILNLPNEQTNDYKPPLKIKQPEIIFQNVNFGYDENFPILKDLNFTIKTGEKIGIVGESGAGKSTIIKLLLRYFTLKEGHILIDGQDINNVCQNSLRDSIALIPQDTILFHRSLLENIQYGNPSANLEEIKNAAKKADIHNFIMNLPKKYQTNIGEKGTKLSGGQRQRIAIARAILKDTPIFVLDEATSSLDSETEKSIQQSLNNIFNNEAKTVIAIAHRLSTIKNMDKIIVLDKGRIVEQGSHKSLLENENGIYKKLYQSQNIMI